MAATTTVNLRVGGMTCASCVKVRQAPLNMADMFLTRISKSIEDGLSGLSGVSAVSVALLAEKATIECDPALWTPEKLAGEIEDLGFEASPLEESSQPGSVLVSVYGMTCASCTSAVESGLMALPGVSEVAVSLVPGAARVTYDASLIGPRTIVDEIQDLGFDAMLADEQSKSTQLASLSRKQEIQEWRHAVLFSLCFGVPVFLLSMVFPMIGFLRPIVNMRLLVRGIYLGDVVCCALTIPVQFGIGRRFYVSAWKALKHKSATMDLLVVISTTTAFAYSSLALISAPFSSDDAYHPMVFFDTSTMLITFIAFGRYLENLAKGQTSAALSKLLCLAPPTATIYTDPPNCKAEKSIPTELIQVDDYVKIVPGDKIPADGVLVSGASDVDESMLTGEASTVNKDVGDVVLGGTTNGAGSFDMRVTKAGRDTTLAQIVKLVEDAQTSKAPIQAFADKVAGYFVPAVISLGLITFIVWMSVVHFNLISPLPHIFEKPGHPPRFLTCLQICISVIVVACPCALGLSTPTAVMVGTGVGASNGILIKGAGPLEASRSIDRVVLDKTGTLTYGRMNVIGSEWLAEDQSQREAILDVVLAAESRSQHPLATAVAEFAKRQLKVDDVPNHVTVATFENVVSLGISSTVQRGAARHSVLIGNAAFLARSQISLPANVDAFRSAHESLGRTVILAAVDSNLALLFAISDIVKPEAIQAIDALRMMGISVVMITGDHQTTANAIGAEVGIQPQDIHASTSPNGKREWVQRMQREGHKVAMVGDGINDSPALAAANVGIALCTGTDIAMEAADIVLMRNDLLDVVAAIDLSKRIFKQIQLNFLWATVYNLMGIPLAMGFLLPWNIMLHPMAAGAMMAFSSVSVVLSSLSLRFWQRPAYALHREDGSRQTSTGFWSEVGKTVSRHGRSISLSKSRHAKLDEEEIPLRDSIV